MPASGCISEGSNIYWVVFRLEPHLLRSCQYLRNCSYLILIWIWTTRFLEFATAQCFQDTIIRRACHRLKARFQNGKRKESRSWTWRTKLLKRRPFLLQLRWRARNCTLPKKKGPLRLMQTRLPSSLRSGHFVLIRRLCQQQLRWLCITPCFCSCPQLGERVAMLGAHLPWLPVLRTSQLTPSQVLPLSLPHCTLFE